MDYNQMDASEILKDQERKTRRNIDAEYVQKAKEALQPLRDRVIAIRGLSGEIQEFRAKIESPSSPRYDAVKVHHSTSDDVMANRMNTLFKLEGQLLTLVQIHVTADYQQIMKVYELEDQYQANVLFSIYYMANTVPKTAELIGKKQRMVNYLHSGGLLAYGKMFCNDDKTL